MTLLLAIVALFLVVWSNSTFTSGSFSLPVTFSITRTFTSLEMRILLEASLLFMAWFLAIALRSRGLLR